jgi:hypothetical protein
MIRNFVPAGQAVLDDKGPKGTMAASRDTSKIPDAFVAVLWAGLASKPFTGTESLASFLTKDAEKH